MKNAGLRWVSSWNESSPEPNCSQAEAAPHRRDRGKELLGVAQVGEHLGLRRFQPETLAGHALGRQFTADQLDHGRVGEGCRADPHQQPGLAAGAFALAKHRDRMAHHPQVDLAEQAMLFGDAGKPDGVTSSPLASTRSCASYSSPGSPCRLSIGW